MKIKIVFLALLGLTLANHTQAQLFSRESVTGAALGGLAGGIIGHNSGRRTGEGIAIGAGSGLLLGALVHEGRRDRSRYVYPAAHYGSGYYTSGYSYPYSYGTYSYGTPYRPNYAWTGAAVGGIAGGIIGHNDGRHTAEGVAIGAGAGLLLGGLAEHAARRRESAQAPVYYVPVASPTVESTETAAPRPIIQNHYQNTAPASPMAGANSLFGR